MRRHYGWHHDFCWIHPNNTSMDDLTTKNLCWVTLGKKHMSWWMRLPHGHRQLTRSSQLKWMEFQLRRQFLWFEKATHIFRFIHDTVDGSENSAHQLRLVVYQFIPLLTGFFLNPRWWSPDFFHQQYLVIHPSKSCWEMCWRFLNKFQAIDLAPSLLKK